MVSEERIMIFIDGSNIFRAIERYRKQKQDENFKINFRKLVDVLAGERKLIRAYYYGSRPLPPNSVQEAFYKKLEWDGFTVTVKELKKRTKVCKKCGQSQESTIEKGVDVALVTDLLAFGFKDGYSTAIVVSGDNDFSGAIEEVKRMPKNVEVVSFENCISSETMRKADKFVSIESIIDKIRL